MLICWRWFLVWSYECILLCRNFCAEKCATKCRAILLFALEKITIIMRNKQFNGNSIQTRLIRYVRKKIHLFVVNMFYFHKPNVLFSRCARGDIMFMVALLWNPHKFFSLSIFSLLLLFDGWFQFCQPIFIHQNGKYFAFVHEHVDSMKNNWRCEFYGWKCWIYNKISNNNSNTNEIGGT